MADNDARFRSIAGLESIDPEVMQAGVGGPGLGTPETYPLWSVDSTASKTAFAVSYDLNALERRAKLLSESLSEATDSVLAHRDLLESTPSILPTAGWISSSYSESRMHPSITGRSRIRPGHFSNQGTSILAAAKGRVIRSGWVVGYGLTIEIGPRIRVYDALRSFFAARGPARPGSKAWRHNRSGRQHRGSRPRHTSITRCT